VRILNAERELTGQGSQSPFSDVLAIGDPDFASMPEGSAAPGKLVAARVRSIDPCRGAIPAHLPPLPATRTEVQSIPAAWDAGYAPRCTVLVGAQASEAAFKHLAPHAAVVHLATHGVVVGDRCEASRSGQRGVGGVAPLEAPPAARPAAPRAQAAADARTDPSPWQGLRVWLAFAGADHAREPARDEDDGMLTAEETVTLNLAGAEWVVLSACYSALAEHWTNEGMLGMRRAFALAGARSVIASRWAVDDMATAAWMRALYKARASGETRATPAIRSACREQLAERRRATLTTHPFYWASFVASGE
jgi:CHAT domain-containing protein